MRPRRWMMGLSLCELIGPMALGAPLAAQAVGPGQWAVAMDHAVIAPLATDYLTPFSDCASLGQVPGGPRDHSNAVALPDGLPGCGLLVPPVFLATRTVGSTGMDRGYAAVDLPFALGDSPTEPHVPPPITGRMHAAQWLILDPASGGFAMTPRHEFRLR